MIIAVNTRLLQKDKLEGIGWFTRETLSRITKNHPEHQFIFIFDRPYDEEFIFSDNIGISGSSSGYRQSFGNTKPIFFFLLMVICR